MNGRDDSASTGKRARTLQRRYLSELLLAMFGYVVVLAASPWTMLWGCR